MTTMIDWMTFCRELAGGVLAGACDAIATFETPSAPSGIWREIRG